ncbi:MAG: hypothetical protein V7K26_01380 [Nostoc sp.]
MSLSDLPRIIERLQEINERRNQAEYGEDIFSLLMSARDEQESG